MRYKLSICMMVKNEEIHLERCLESLKSIIDRDDVELIIVDTGSSDDTITIAKKYTDKVYFKEWFYDFSGMRNVTVSYATGRWILIIDADEVVENVDDFLKFIDSELLYSKVNTFFLKVKNYTNLNNLNSFASMISPRIFKNDGAFKYQGTVHNQPIYKKPIKHINIILGHFGYITSNKKIMDEKFLRTSTLLIKELEKNPNNIYYMLQLATTYNMHGDMNDAYKVSKKTYDLIMELSKKEQLSSYAIFSIHISNCIALGKFTETIEVCQRSIDLRSDYIDAYFSLVYSYEKLGQIEEARNYAIIYLDLCERFSELDISKDDAIIIYRNDISTINKVKLMLATYYLARNEYVLAKEYLHDLPMNVNTVNIHVTICVELEEIDYIKQLYEENISTEELEDTFFQILEEKMEKIDSVKKANIRKLFIDINHIYSDYCKFTLIDSADTTVKVKYAEKLYSSAAKHKPSFYVAEALACIIEEKNLTLNLFNKIDKSYIFYYINYFYNKKYVEVYLKLFEWIKKLDYNQSTIKNEFTLKFMIEAIILRLATEYKSTGIDSTIKDNMDIFEKYIELGLKLINQLYVLDGMSIKYEYIAEFESKFLVLMYLYRENINNGNLKAALKYYKLAVKTYPEIADFMKEYITIE